MRPPAALRRLAAALVASVVAVAAPPAGAADLAITFDDLPAHSVLPPGETRAAVATKIIAALKAAGAPEVYGFVNGVQEELEPASIGVLAAWRAAGFPLGNHAWSHMNLGARPLADWEADVSRNEPLLQRHMGAGDWRWLRYPFLSEGDTAEKRADARAYLKARGYRIAQVTMGFGDYAFNEPYARCVAKGDVATIAKLEQAFLAAAADDIERAHAMSVALTGRDIPYVLLMHLGAFDARMLPRLLELYRARGFNFVTLPRAEADPFYGPSVDPSGTGPDTLEAALAVKGLAAPLRKVDLAWLDTACR